jgi:hypothetical protein
MTAGRSGIGLHRRAVVMRMTLDGRKLETVRTSDDMAEHIERGPKLAMAARFADSRRGVARGPSAVKGTHAAQAGCRE